MEKPKKKCGSCAHFQVRNADEAQLARIVRDESECAPGEWVFRGERREGCHGGPVLGICGQIQRQVFSTQVCPQYKPGGPVLRRAGSPNITDKARNITARLSGDGSLGAVGAVLVLTIASMVKRRIR